MEEGVKRRVFISAALAVCAAVPYDSIAAQRKQADPCVTDTTRWHFSVTPYLWASGIKGDVGARDRSAHVDVSFDRILRHLDGAFMLPMEAWKGRVGVAAEVIYLKVSDDRSTTGRFFTGADASASTFIGEFAPRVRVVSNKTAQVDVLFGTRMWYLDNSLALHRPTQPDLEADDKQVWWDRFVGARVFYNVTDKLLVQVRGDIGGFDALYTWQAIGGLAYTISPKFTVRAGYRQLDVNYVEGGNGLIYDVGLGGPILGLSYKF
jgi:hypothetical protein